MLGTGGWEGGGRKGKGGALESGAIGGLRKEFKKVRATLTSESKDSLFPVYTILHA